MPDLLQREAQRAVYTPGQAGALAGVSGYSIGQWARYGLMASSVRHGRPQNLYSYFDIQEAIVVHWLRSERFSFDEIHQALDDLKREYPKWPLSTAPIGIGRQSPTADRGSLVRERGRKAYTDLGGRGPGQAVIPPRYLELSRDVLRRGGWIAKEHNLERIEVIPGKLGGQPTLRDRRWPVAQVARIAGDDEGRSVLLRDYELTEEEVDEAITWTREAAALV